MDERVIDVECNERQYTNCAIRLDHVFCDGYKDHRSIGAFSHFHEDHIAAVLDCIGSYDVLITHPITFEGIVALKSGIRYRMQWVTQDFGVKYKTKVGHVELLKANHIPGSSQIYVESDGRSLLYSGDFGFPDVQITHADYLVIDSTHGDPWYDGKTDRKSVMSRLFEDIKEKMDSEKQIVIQTSSGTLQELVRHFEITYGQRLQDDVTFVMDKTQENVLKNIYKEEQDEFRDVVHYDSREFWDAMRNNRKCVIFSTKSILDDKLRSCYRIIIDRYRFKKTQGPIIPFDNGCRYNLAAHASIGEIYSYVEAVNPKYVVTDNSRSSHAPKLAKLIEQKFPNIRTEYRPPTYDE